MTLAPTSPLLYKATAMVASFRGRAHTYRGGDSGGRGSCCNGGVLGDGSGDGSGGDGDGDGDRGSRGNGADYGVIDGVGNGGGVVVASCRGRAHT